MTMKTKESTVFTLELARAHIRDLQREAAADHRRDQARRRQTRRPRRAAR
ncbi:MAG: hypothetical protein QOE01_2333 [Actinomycetota bacterium]|jgi:hypothetical protein|nr:hypothetical protein [Actinomycetota bacterium]